MPDGLVFEVKGVPRAQPRGRHVGGRVVSTTGPARRFRLAVKEAATAAGLAAMPDGRGGIRPMGGAVELVLVVRFPTKKAERVGHWRTAVRDRDADNLAKLVMDAVADAGVMPDDGSVARLVVESLWCAPACEGVSVAIRALGARRSGAQDVAARVVPVESVAAQEAVQAQWREGRLLPPVWLAGGQYKKNPAD